MHHKLTIVSVFESNKEPFTVLIEIHLKTENARLLHLAISGGQDCNQIIHQYNIRKEYMKYREKAVRNYTTLHLFIIVPILCNYTIK